MTEMLNMLSNNKITHNKKRNIGLVYEFFTKYIGKAILENRQNDVERAKILIRKHFNKTTDLYRELHLFKTLRESRYTNRDSAVHLVNRIREVVKNQSQTRLDMEKTSLIHEINQTLNDPNFFNQTISDYKLFGTIQILLNSWRNPEILNENVVAITNFEETLIEHLLTPKKEQEILFNKQIPNANGIDPNAVNRLVVDIMADKINKKFDNLNENQKKIVSLYVLQEENTKAKEELLDLLGFLKNKFLSYFENGSNNLNESVSNKLIEVKDILNKNYNDTTLISDDLITFYLGISKLEKEMNSNG